MKGWAHWERLLKVREYLQGHPRPINNTKIYGADGNRFGDTTQDAVERFWRILLAGCASARFHRPDSGLGLNGLAVASLRSARAVESRIPFWKLKPRAERLLLPEQGNAWMGAAPGEGAVVFIPRQQPQPEVTVDLSDLGLKRGVSIQWINAETGDARAPEPLGSAGGPVTLRCPDAGNWIAVIR
ncbi:MAG TPA: hypothetical protein PLX03_01930 [Candidatus Hydrogenedentes bacterium]|nr:hypothetical protein [Candidatus Hydrogenedentota bacterium]